MLLSVLEHTPRGRAQWTRWLMPCVWTCVVAMTLLACGPTLPTRPYAVRDGQPRSLPVFGRGDATYVLTATGSRHLNGKVELAGDLTGDGVPDIVLGARPRGSDTRAADVLHIVEGPLSREVQKPKYAADVILPAGAWRLRDADFVRAGDIDGDGAEDLLVWLALFVKEEAKPKNETVAIYDGFSPTPREPPPPPEPLLYPGYYVIRGPLSGEIAVVDQWLLPTRRAARAQPAGDLDGDGKADLVLVKPGFMGEADLVSMQPGPIEGPFELQRAAYIATGGNTFGAMADVSIAGAAGDCDLDGDGKDDLLTWTSSQVDDWRQINLSLSPQPAKRVVMEDDATIYDVGSRGRTAVCLGKVDQVKGDDIVVADEVPITESERTKHLDRPRPLHLLLFSGGLRGAHYAWDARMTVALPGLTIYGFEAAGDVNEDGAADLLVWGESSNHVHTFVFVDVSGEMPEPIVAVELHSEDPRSTDKSVAVGDVDQDGQPDLLLGVPQKGAKTKVLVFSGARLFPRPEVEEGDEPSDEGDSLAPPPADG